MSKKLTILDRISIPSPCPATWDSMTGSRRQRFCRQCNKTVYNLSAMTRDEAEALVARFAGRLCARIERDAGGVTITEEVSAAPQLISRRASPVAAALVSAMIGLGGNVMATTLGTNAPAGVQAPLDRQDRGPQSQGGTATLSGVVKDPAGAVIPNAKVTLVNQATGTALGVTTSNDEGAYSFTALAEGTYTVKIEAEGFAITQMEGVQVSPGQNLSTELQLAAKTELVTVGGAMVVVPQPLRALYNESELIIVGRVGRSKTVKTTETNEMQKTTLEVASLVKGSSRRGRITVYNWGWGEDKQFPGGLKTGDTALFFLKKRDGGDGFEINDYSYGVKKLAPADLSVYLKRLEELKAISQSQSPEMSAIVEWLVRCAEQRATRWEGAVELLRSAERDADRDADEGEAAPGDQAEATADQASVIDKEVIDKLKLPDQQAAASDSACSKPGDEPDFAAMLSDEQKGRLQAALYNVGEITADDIELVRLVRLFKDERLVPFLLEQLRRELAGPPRLAEGLMSIIAETMNDDDIKSLAEAYGQEVSYADLDAEENADSQEAETTDSDAADDQEPDAMTARQQRSKLLQQFIAAVEKKRANPHIAAGEEK
ncbi:MAG TPA: carboxypeptidase-like regulatory domain-containing protein [Blastocatellia bacterium]|nr:carboxypeptidase-like regulatory domain-containing protein [Blastocatellia bacterium]